MLNEKENGSGLCRNGTDWYDDWHRVEPRGTSAWHARGLIGSGSVPIGRKLVKVGDPLIIIVMGVEVVSSLVCIRVVCLLSLE